MARSETVRLLYIGRRQQVAKSLNSAIKADEDIANAAELRNQKIAFKVVTNQKAVLEFMRAQTPNVLLIEVDGKRDSRRRFCEMLRYRLPQALILSVSKFDVDSSFEFDDHIALPLLPPTAVETINLSLDKLVNHKLERGHVQLNIAKRTVVTPEGEQHMSPKQCALLNMLMQNHNQAVRREDIMREIWETEFMEDTRTLDVHIRWLRQVIEPNSSKPQYLVTIRKVGYRLCLE